MLPPPVGSGFSVLWLILLSLVQPVFGVCTVCFNDAQGCKGDPNTCPWAIGVAANVAAITAAGAAIVKLDQLLPARYLRLFTAELAFGLPDLLGGTAEFAALSSLLGDAD